MAVEFKNDRDRLSYALAVNIASSIRHMPMEFNNTLIAAAITDLLNGGQIQFTREEFQEWGKKLDEALREAAGAKARAANAGAIEEAKKFFAANAQKEGVKTTATGLQYLVLAEGNGSVHPKRTDVVKVHYEGKLLNGTVFDSSIKRGEPIEFPLNQVIPGWTEGVQLMTVGAKYRFFIPSELAYGEQGAGNLIPPCSALIFEVELLDIKSR